MKQLRLASLMLATAALMPYLSSCKSDPNPFDVIFTMEDNSAKIRLNLNVASTRADLSTSEENAISKVSIFVFDANNKLEMPASVVEITDRTSKEISVSPGMKTIYAISATTGISASEGTSILDFEKMLLDSKLSDLKLTVNEDESEFVMIGKSASQQVYKSASESDIPASNVFSIEMVRLLSKTQVRTEEDLDASSFGFTAGTPSFNVSQTCNKMRIVADYTSDIPTAETSSPGVGTYKGYSVGNGLEYKEVTSGDFSASDCHYISENIVQNPVSGNTTFVSLCIPLTPDNYYTYDAETAALNVAGEGQEGASFYAVGIIDVLNGMEDFALDQSTKHVVVFKTPEEARDYADALNGGDASATTVSEYETPLRAVSEYSETNARQFSVITFDEGKAYYRINIKNNEGKFMVERNTFYKITVNSLVKNLGYHSEELLRPENEDSTPENSTSAWIGVKLTVVQWEEVGQEAKL